MSKQTIEALAYALAKHVHEGQKYGEHDYFQYHVLGVAASFSDTNLGGYYDHEAYVTALLHDVVEDTRVTSGVIDILFGKKIGEDVYLLSNHDCPSYEDYICRLTRRGCESVRKVKIADLKFHLSQPVIRNEDKYRKALAVLEGKS